MAYQGQTYIIDCSRGGFSHNPNPDAIRPVDFIHPSRNINLHRNGRGKRGGTSKVNATAIDSGARIVGVYDFTLENSTQFVMKATANGKLYKNNTDTIKTGMSTVNKFWFENFENELYICDGDTVPQTWDGSAGATSAITNPAAEWAAGNEPRYMVAHGRNLSKRMVAFGVDNDPKSVWLSANGNGKEFVTGVVKIVIETRDAWGIVGGIEIGEQMVLFGRKKPYALVDSDEDSTNWGYAPMQWEGGAAHQRLIVKTPNDVHVMDETGNIYSISAVQNFGDYQVASLTKPAWLDKWIKDYVDLAYIDDFHACYDPVLRCVDWSIVRSGQTQVDTALRFFIDRPVDEAWTVVDNQSYNSGYKASCSTLVRTGAGTYKRYNGDYSGFIWELETASYNDDSNPYYGGFKIGYLNLENPRTRKHFRRLRILTRPEGNYSLAYSWWLDGNSKTAGTISLLGTGGVLGSFVLNTSLLGGIELIDKEGELEDVGKRAAFELYNSTVNQGFFISQVMIDHTPLGAIFG